MLRKYSSRAARPCLRRPFVASGDNLPSTSASAIPVHLPHRACDLRPFLSSLTHRRPRAIVILRCRTTCFLIPVPPPGGQGSKPDSAFSETGHDNPTIAVCKRGPNSMRPQCPRPPIGDATSLTSKEINAPHRRYVH